MSMRRASAISGLSDEKLTTIGLLVSLVVLWQAVSLLYPPHQFPGLGDLVVSFLGLASGSGEYGLIENVSLTLARIALSVLIAMILGTAIGVSMGLSDFAEGYFKIYVLLALAVPALVWAFLATLWFGLTMFLVPVFTGVLVLLPYVIINTWEGTKAIDRDLVEMAGVFGGGGTLLWRRVYFPQLLPFLLSSLRTVISVGWKIMLVAEIFGAQSGVGYVINHYFIVQQNDMILVWTISVMIIVFGVERLLRRYERRQFEWSTAGTDDELAVAT